MNGTPATVLCTKHAIAFEVRTYEVDPKADNYGPAAAEALGLSYTEVFKTLVAEVDGRAVVAVVPVDRLCNTKALAAAMRGKRAEMAAPATAERLTGYVVGGISPLGQKRRLPTVIDQSAAALATMWVSGGRRGLEIGLAPADLVTLTLATLAPIAT